MNTWTVIGILVSAIGVILGGIQWMLSNAIKKGAINQKVNDAHEKIKQYNNKSIECEKRFVQLEERKSDNKAIENIRTDIAYIKVSLGAILSGGNSVNALIQSNSPISLTQIGKELAIRMQIESRIANNWDKIYAYLEKNLPSKNAYDIQQFCIERVSVYLDHFFSEEDVMFIKDFAYKEGKPLAYYGGMIGVMIRDAYFKHEGIDVSEIDKCDPGQKA